MIFRVCPFRKGQVIITDLLGPWAKWKDCVNFVSRPLRLPNTWTQRNPSQFNKHSLSFYYILGIILSARILEMNEAFLLPKQFISLIWMSFWKLR